MDAATVSIYSRLDSHRRVAAAAIEMIAEHLDVAGGHVAWSGGKDSTAVAVLATTVDPTVPIVTYVAGTEYPEVLPYCATVARERGWTWETIQTGDITALLDSGAMPGEGDWWDIMIAGPASIAHARHGPGLLWGLRSDESPARAAMLQSTRGVRDRADGIRTCAPLWRASTGDVLAVLHSASVPLCPTYSVMEQVGVPEQDRRVGRIIGRRGMRARMRWLRRGWPEIANGYEQRWPWLRDIQ